MNVKKIKDISQMKTNSNDKHQGAFADLTEFQRMNVSFVLHTNVPVTNIDVY